MTGPGTHRRSRARRIFRGCRITGLVIVLLAALLLLWSNYVRVPEFIASPIRSELRRSNVALEFGRLRLSGFRRVVAEDLRIAPAAAAGGARMEASEAELLLRFSRAGRRFEISGLRLKGGQLVAPVAEPGAPPRDLSVRGLEAQVEFLPGDALRIVTLSGEAFGARADVSGVLRNFSRFRPAGGAADGPHWRRQVAEVAEIAEQLGFAEPPELTVRFTADAADLASSRATVALRADQGLSRWGTFQRLRLNSAIHPLTNEAALKGTFALDLEDLRSGTVRLGSVRLTAETRWAATMQQLLSNHVSLALARAETRWFSTPGLELTLESGADKERITSKIGLAFSELSVPHAQFLDGDFRASLRHPLPFPAPARWLGRMLTAAPAPPARPPPQEVTGRWRFQSARARLPRAEAEAVTLSGEIAPRQPASEPDPAAGFWDWLRPFDLPWELQVSNLKAGDARIGSLSSRGRWSFPELNAAVIDASLYNGKLTGQSRLDVRTRQLTVSSKTSFDYHQAAILLDSPARRWLDQFRWESPPMVESELSLILPPWTGSWEGASGPVLASLSLDGRFAGRGSFRGIPLGLAESRFSLVNSVWSLPGLKITRPEGQALVRCTGNLTNGQIAAVIESQVDPAILAAAFDSSQQQAFTMVRFSSPPWIQAELTAEAGRPESLAARGRLSATNFFVKEQALSGVQTAFYYTNQTVELSGLSLHRGAEELRAPLARIDFPGEVMFVTNAVSTIDPWVAMSLVGEDAYEAIDPYRFASTPEVRVNGYVPLRHYSKADIHFHVTGTDFTFWRFRLPSLSGDVFWKANQINFSNVVAGFYGGSADWSGHFVIDERTDVAYYNFRGRAANASLQPLVRDLFATTNRLEGRFGGELVITSANTASDQSWNGHGHAALEDGYLWSVPVFGVFSRALDAVAPGFGSAPVSSGTGNFTITNSVVHTRDFQVRTPAFRLSYEGSVDLEGKLDASVEAEILRDTWLLGRFFSAALWPVSKAFEARVSGTLNNPQTKLRYIPRFVFAPFRALGALGEAARRNEGKPPPVEGRSPDP